MQPTLLAHPELTRAVRCGLDEVGRGCLAGPLVAAGVVLPAGFVEGAGQLAKYLRDSKTVPRAHRSEIAAYIRAHAHTVEIVEIPVKIINLRGIGWANREAFRILISRITADEYIVDGRVKPPAPADRAARVRCLVDADALEPAVSAASLVAKVHRDALMCEMHRHFPVYKWDTNAGYGTAAHLDALREHGATSEHRTQFVATALGTTRKRARNASPTQATLASTLD